MNLTMMPVIPLPKRGEAAPRAPEQDSPRGAAPPPSLGPCAKLWDPSSSSACSSSLTAAVQSGSWRVKADVLIPAHTTAGPYPSEVLIGMNTADSPKADNTVKVTVREGRMVACPSSRQPPCHWMTCVTPARDRHEQNVEAVRDPRGSIVFRALKDIPRGSELLVWYSAELAMECAIPILTPLHIKSDQDYVCTGCDVSFRYPNTLKAHLRFHCARNPMTSWVSQYPALQTSAGSLLTAYQYEISKYFSQLGTLWSLRNKMAAVNQAPTAPDHAFRPITTPAMASHPVNKTSAFRPCGGQRSKGQSSPAFSPSHSPLSQVGGKVSSTSPSPPARRVSHEDHHKKPLSHGAESLRRGSGQDKDAVGRHAPYPAVPTYLDKLYMYNYASCMRPGLAALPTDLTRTFQRTPFSPPAVDFSTTAAHHEALMGARGLSHSAFGAGMPSSVRRRESSSPRDEPQSPQSEREASPPTATVPIPAVNFPLPSESAGEPIDLLPKSLYMSKAYKGHLCIYCGKLYSRKYGLKIHLRTHTGYKPLKCKVCLRPFGDPSNLNKHIRLHAEGDTPYRCDQCGKVLVRRRDLERHIKSRHPPEGMRLLADENIDAPCDTDSSFIDVDDDENVEDTDDEGPLDMSRHDSSLDTKVDMH